MRFPRTKIEKALGESNKVKDFYLDTKNNCLVAADGFILAAVDVQVYDNDESGTVPRCVADLVGCGAIEYIQVRRNEVLAGEISIRTDGEFEYPDYRSVIKRTGENYKNMRPHLCIDAKKFWKLAQAICGPTNGGMRYSVNVWIGDTGECDSIIVEPTQGGAVGVIMQVQRSGGKDDQIDPVEITNRLRNRIFNDSDIVQLDGDLLDSLRRLYGVELAAAENALAEGDK